MLIVSVPPRWAVACGSAVTHNGPLDPAVSAVGLLPTSIDPTTRPLSGSSRYTLPAWGLAAQTLSPATAMLVMPFATRRRP